MRKWPLVVAALMLSATWGVLQSLSRAESVQAKKPFVEFPLDIDGRWQGTTLAVDPNVLDVLQLGDYMMRVYVPMGSLSDAARETVPESDSAPEAKDEEGQEKYVSLYVGYYPSQRTGATYHSPKNCLPGAGWQFTAMERTAVEVPGAREIKINRAVVQKGAEKEVMLYWYHDRGRVIASEYSAKGYLIWDAITRNRTDGALVRIMIPVTTTTEAAEGLGLDFLEDVWPLLQEYMPA